MKAGLIILLVGSFTLNLIFIARWFMHPGEKSARTENQSISRSQFPYLSPRIFVEDQNDILINFTDLRSDLHKYAADAGDHLGFYFEYLPSGASIGVGEQIGFVPASLLKVPLAMAVYKNIEEGKLKKDQVLTVSEKNLDSFFGDLWRKGAGTKVTVNEAINLMLIFSDNTAKSVLFDAVPGGVESVFDALDIPKELSGSQAVVTPKNYSSVLRSLYLSSYLKKEDSNEILDILTQSPFGDMLVAGVGEGVKVAHKIGVYEPKSATKSVFTDCGIVFVPSRPYILCVMVRDSEDVAVKYMSEISRTTYNFVSSYGK